ncbi:helix-turn-helix transcriptional regulator [Enterococcus plantarum]|uniref:helix-turn-helix transcriptional regulator n=1 Tax=Enterococcus plantarum TaxID=1077675 RepID=UPI001A8C5C8B|nr:helix-turn-helix transcriptional regulator [Enterococcus plantarum]MBO0423372.1 helix-turn-helix transcriptional regulator [Enterococcus plantarum]
MPKKKNSSFESSIHVYRAIQRMTQQQLADKVGVSRQTIIQLERNRYNPSLLLAHDIADVFKVPIEQIFTFTRIGEPETMEMVDVED